MIAYNMFNMLKAGYHALHMKGGLLIFLSRLSMLSGQHDGSSLQLLACRDRSAPGGGVGWGVEGGTTCYRACREME